MLGAQPGELHPRRAAADHQHPLRLRRPLGQVAQLPLVRPERVDAAGVAEPLHLLAVDALVQPDARADRHGVRAPGLVDDVEIGERRPGHGHQVGVAGGQHGLRLLGRGDPPGVDDRQVRGLLHLAAQRRPLDVVVPAGRDVRRGAEVVADVEAEVVDRAVGGERLHQPLTLLQPVPAVDELVDAQAKPVGERAWRVAADGVGDLPQVADAVLEAAAVAVGAQVGERGEEPLDHVVVVGVDLDDVHPGIDGQRGRLAVLAHEPLDLVDVQGVGDAVVVVGAERRRRGDRLAALLHHLDRHGGGAGVLEAADELADARRVAGVAEVAWAVRTDARRLEALRQWVADVRRRAADPLEPAGGLR